MSFSKQLKKLGRSSIALSAICLTTWLVTVSVGVTVNAQGKPSYGLGLPRTAGTGGATRGTLPLVTMLIPEDGGRTVSSRPTFYWYVSPERDGAVASKPFQVTFFLRENPEISAKSVFKAEGETNKSGLYKFTLPDSAPPLEVGKVQRWQIRWRSETGSTQVDVNGMIMLAEASSDLRQALSKAATDLDKARVYASKSYWYDALDAYSKWLEANPKDATARQERSSLLMKGFDGHSAITDAKILKTLLTEVDAQPAIALSLSSKAGSK